MNRILLFFFGYCRIQVVGASVQWFLNRLSRERIPFWDLEWVDPLTVEMRIFPRDLLAAEQFAEMEQCQLQHSAAIGLSSL